MNTRRGSCRAHPRKKVVAAVFVSLLGCTPAVEEVICDEVDKGHPAAVIKEDCTRVRATMYRSVTAQPDEWAEADGFHLTVPAEIENLTLRMTDRDKETCRADVIWRVFAPSSDDFEDWPAGVCPSMTIPVAPDEELGLHVTAQFEGTELAYDLHLEYE